MGTKSTTEADIDIGRRITVARKRARVSQTALGQALGVTFQQVQKYEKGQNRVTSGKLRTIAQALGCTMADLIGDEVEGRSMPQLSLAAIELAQAFDRIPQGDLKAALRAAVLAAAVEEAA